MRIHLIYSICLFAEINSAIGNLQARDSVQRSDPQTIFRSDETKRPLYE